MFECLSVYDEDILFLTSHFSFISITLTAQVFVASARTCSFFGIEELKSDCHARNCNHHYWL